MKKTLIILNVLAAIALVLLGMVAASAHRTHAFSVYTEMRQRGALVEQPEYDVKQRLQTIAGGGVYSSTIAWLGAVICIANAVAVGFYLRRPNS